MKSWINWLKSRPFRLQLGLVIFAGGIIMGVDMPEEELPFLIEFIPFFVISLGAGLIANALLPDG